MFGDLGDLNDSVYGTYAVPDPANPNTTSLVLGRRDGETIRDVVTVGVSDGPIDLTTAPEVEQFPTTLGSLEVTAYVVDGRTTFGWESGDLLVTMSDGPDAVALAEAIVATPGADGSWRRWR